MTENFTIKNRVQKEQTDYFAIRKRLGEQKGIALYDNEDIKYLDTTVGKAVYTTKKKSNGAKKLWSDRVKCKVCGTEYTRSSASRHNKTRHHQDFLSINEKMRDIMLPSNLTSEK